MKVFAVYSEEKAPLVRVWMESWSKQGWQPRLLSEKEVKDAGSPRRALEKRAKAGVLSDIQVINFSLGYHRHLRLRAVLVGDPGWRSAGLVRFPEGSTENTVRECGRDL